jgi:predicted lactoylglutathione lyase
MEQRISLVTLGVEDLARSRAFYEALGWRTGAQPTDDVVFFQAGGMILGLWSRESLAEDSGVTDPGGFGGITLAYNTRSNEEVDQIVAEAQAAGGTVSKAPAETFWGGYSGVFLDLDGHPWEVAHNPHWTLGADGDVHLGGLIHAADLPSSPSRYGIFMSVLCTASSGSGSLNRSTTLDASG